MGDHRSSQKCRAAPSQSARPCLAHSWTVAGPQQEWVQMGAASFPHTEAWGRTPLPRRFRTPTEEREGPGELLA